MEKHILLTTKAEVADASSQLNALTNVINNVGGSMLQIIGMNLRMVQSNIAVRNSIWGIVDAERAHERLAMSRLELDAQQAELNVRLAQRQSLITQRTGRRLDVEQARLNVAMAQRDLDLTMHDIDTQKIEDSRRMTKAGEANWMAMEQQKLMYKQMYLQMGLMIIQTGILIKLMWTEIATIVAKHSALTLGIGTAIAVGAVAAGYGIVKGMAPEPPSAQTEYGQVKMVTETGIIKAHKGEEISQSYRGGDSKITQNFYGSVTRETADYSRGELGDLLTQQGALRPRMAT